MFVSSVDDAVPLFKGSGMKRMSENRKAAHCLHVAYDHVRALNVGELRHLCAALIERTSRKIRERDELKWESRVNQIRQAQPGK